MRPSRSVVAPDLQRWLESSGEEDRRTVVVRVRSSADPQEVGTRLREMGARFQPPAAGALVCAVTPQVLRELAEQPWVIAVDPPRQLFPRVDTAG
jgi:hypothetical protein